MHRDPGAHAYEANFAKDIPQDNRFWSLYGQLDAAFQMNYRETSRATSIENRLAHQSQRLQWAAGLLLGRQVD